MHLKTENKTPKQNGKILTNKLYHMKGLLQLCPAFT